MEKLNAHEIEQEEKLKNYYKLLGFEEGDIIMSGNMDDIIIAITQVNGGGGRYKTKRVRKSKRKSNKRQK